MPATPDIHIHLDTAEVAAVAIAQIMAALNNGDPQATPKIAPEVIAYAGELPDGHRLDFGRNLIHGDERWRSIADAPGAHRLGLPSPESLVVIAPIPEGT